MKKTKRCPKCQGTKIGRLHSVTDADGKYADKSRVLGRPAYGDDDGSALVEAIVCTQCGFFEEYVKAPESVAWLDMPSFSWL